MHNLSDLIGLYRLMALEREIPVKSMLPLKSWRPRQQRPFYRTFLGLIQKMNRTSRRNLQLSTMWFHYREKPWTSSLERQQRSCRSGHHANALKLFTAQAWCLLLTSISVSRNIVVPVVAYVYNISNWSHDPLSPSCCRPHSHSHPFPADASSIFVIALEAFSLMALMGSMQCTLFHRVSGSCSCNLARSYNTCRWCGHGRKPSKGETLREPAVAAHTSWYRWCASMFFHVDGSSWLGNSLITWHRAL